jgi:hypothetical protein
MDTRTQAPRKGTEGGNPGQARGVILPYTPPHSNVHRAVTDSVFRDKPWDRVQRAHGTTLVRKPGSGTQQMQSTAEQMPQTLEANTPSQMPHVKAGTVTSVTLKVQSLDMGQL